MLPIIDTCYNSSDHCIEEKLYIPCLEWATKFDRGVGYFTSGWLSHTAKGMASFAQRGGRARWLTSPILDEQDYNVIRSNFTNEEILSHFRQAISRVIISMHGNDLLKQWVKECLSDFEADIQVYQHFESNKDLQRFLLCRKKCILIISRDAGYLAECLLKLETRIPTGRDSTLFVFDEVHGFGASSFRRELTGKIAPYRYRLGLSATPEREYDELGNEFIRDEIGSVIYTFGLEDAIRNGILSCPMRRNIWAKKIW